MAGLCRPSLGVALLAIVYTVIVVVFPCGLLNDAIRNERWINNYSSQKTEIKHLIVRLILPTIPSATFIISFIIFKPESFAIKLLSLFSFSLLSTILAWRLWYLHHKAIGTVEIPWKLLLYFFVHNSGLWFLFFVFGAANSKWDLALLISVLIFAVSLFNLFVADFFLRQESSIFLLIIGLDFVFMMLAFGVSETSDKLIARWLSVQINSSPCVMLKIQSLPKDNTTIADDQD